MKNVFFYSNLLRSLARFYYSRHFKLVLKFSESRRAINCNDSVESVFEHGGSYPISSITESLHICYYLMIETLCNSPDYVTGALNDLSCF